MTASVDRDVQPVRPGQRARREPRWTNHQEPVEPVATRRLSGDHWWDPDRLAHEADLPTTCPACGANLDAVGTGSIAVEYWVADRRVYHVRCDECGVSTDVSRTGRDPEADTAAGAAAGSDPDGARACPGCGAGSGHGLTVAASGDEAHRLACAACGWQGEVARVEMLIGHEPPHHD